MKRSTVGTKYSIPEGLTTITIARAYLPSWSLLPESVDELPNQPYPRAIYFISCQLYGSVNNNVALKVIITITYYL